MPDEKVDLEKIQAFNDVLYGSDADAIRGIRKGASEMVHLEGTRGKFGRKVVEEADKRLLEIAQAERQQQANNQARNIAQAQMDHAEYLQGQAEAAARQREWDREERARIREISQNPGRFD